MRVLSRQGLIALILASMTFAAILDPVIVEGISHPVLEIRQTPPCQGSYTSKNGMNFTSYCNQNNPFNDALNVFEASSMELCIEFCSRFWGDGEGCFGIVWIENNQQCWLRNSTTSIEGFKPETGTHSALIIEGQLDALDEKCPEPDLSTHSLKNVDSVSYTIHCDKVIGGFDACFSGYANCFDSPFMGFWHATSLEECLEVCVEEHPLCQAVSYNPGMEIGFANCWPKTGFSNSSLSNPPTSYGVLHTATLNWLEIINVTCPSDRTYQSASDISFDIQCGQSNGGINITSIHTKNITACMDACANGNQGCTGVTFDSTLQGGFENCYLQNTTGIIAARAEATYAAVKSSDTGNNPGNGSNGASGGGSKAWIAGPVVGGIVAIALVAFGLFWWRRRKSPAASSGAELESTEKGMPEADGVAMNEVDGVRSPNEMLASTKYAHMLPSDTSPVELPGSTEHAQMTNVPKSPQELP